MKKDKNKIVEEVKKIKRAENIDEQGNVLYLDETSENKVRASKKLAGLICHSTANFTEIKSVVTSVVSNLGYTMEISDSKNKTFIEGRVADVEGKAQKGSPDQAGEKAVKATKKAEKAA